MRLLHELSRRKLRTTLTIVGITIGIWALVVFSSMANQMRDGLIVDDENLSPVAVPAQVSPPHPLPGQTPAATAVGAVG